MIRGTAITTATLVGLLACTSVPPVPAVSVEGLDFEVQAAIEAARAAALADPGSGQASGHVGMVLQAHQLYRPAVLAYERAIRLEPKQFAWRYYRALSLEQLFKLDAALAAIDDALRIRPDYAPAILKRAGLLFKLARFKEADAALAPSLAQNPGSASILYPMARIKFAERDFQASEDLYRRACDAFPAYGAAWYGLADVGRRLGHTANSAKYAQLAESYKDRNPPADDELFAEVQKLATGIESRLSTARKLMDARRFDEATRLYREILKTHPDHPDCLLNLLYMAQFPNQSSPAEVEALYASAVRVAPQMSHVYLYYGTALASQGKYEAAVTSIEKAIAMEPDDSEAHGRLADVREKQKRPALAIEQYRLALALQPDYRAARLELGKILVGAGRNGEAIAVLLPTLNVQDPYTAYVMLFLMQAYENLGDREHARQYLEQARAEVLKNGPPDLVPLIEQSSARMGAGR